MEELLNAYCIWFWFDILLVLSITIVVLCRWILPKLVSYILSKQLNADVNIGVIVIVPLFGIHFFAHDVKIIYHAQNGINDDKTNDEEIHDLQRNETFYIRYYKIILLILAEFLTIHIQKITVDLLSRNENGLEIGIKASMKAVLINNICLNDGLVSNHYGVKVCFGNYQNIVEYARLYQNQIILSHGIFELIVDKHVSEIIVNMNDRGLNYGFYQYQIALFHWIINYTVDEDGDEDQEAEMKNILVNQAGMVLRLLKKCNGIDSTKSLSVRINVRDLTFGLNQDTFSLSSGIIEFTENEDVSKIIFDMTKPQVILANTLVDHTAMVLNVLKDYDGINSMKQHSIEINVKDAECCFNQDKIALSHGIVKYTENENSTKIIFDMTKPQVILANTLVDSTAMVLNVLKDYDGIHSMKQHSIEMNVKDAECCFNRDRIALSHGMVKYSENENNTKIIFDMTKPQVILANTLVDHTAMVLNVLKDYDGINSMKQHSIEMNVTDAECFFNQDEVALSHGIVKYTENENVSKIIFDMTKPQVILANTLVDSTAMVLNVMKDYDGINSMKQHSIEMNVKDAECCFNQDKIALSHGIVKYTENENSTKIIFDMTKPQVILANTLVDSTAMVLNILKDYDGINSMKQHSIELNVTDAQCCFNQDEVALSHGIVKYTENENVSKIIFDMTKPQVILANTLVDSTAMVLHVMKDYDGINSMKQHSIEMNVKDAECCFNRDRIALSHGLIKYSENENNTKIIFDMTKPQVIFANTLVDSTAMVLNVLKDYDGINSMKQHSIEMNVKDAECCFNRDRIALSHGMVKYSENENNTKIIFDMTKPQVILANTLVDHTAMVLNVMKDYDGINSMKQHSIEMNVKDAECCLNQDKIALSHGIVKYTENENSTKIIFDMTKPQVILANTLVDSTAMVLHVMKDYDGINSMKQHSIEMNVKDAECCFNRDRIALSHGLVKYSENENNTKIIFDMTKPQVILSNTLVDSTAMVLNVMKDYDEINSMKQHSIEMNVTDAECCFNQDKIALSHGIVKYTENENSTKIIFDMTKPQVILANTLVDSTAMVLNILKDYDGINSMKQHSIEMNVTDAQCCFNQDEVALSHGIVKYTENENVSKIIFDMTKPQVILANTLVDSTAMVLHVMKDYDGINSMKQHSIEMNVKDAECCFNRDRIALSHGLVKYSENENNTKIIFDMTKPQVILSNTLVDSTAMVLNVMKDYDEINSMKQHSIEMNVTDAECLFNQDEIALSHGIVKYTENENNTKVIFDMTKPQVILSNTLVDSTAMVLNVLKDYDGIDSMKQHSVEMNVTDAVCFFNQDEIALSHGIVKYTENENNTKVIFDMTKPQVILANTLIDSTAMVLNVMKDCDGINSMKQHSIEMNVKDAECCFNQDKIALSHGIVKYTENENVSKIIFDMTKPQVILANTLVDYTAMVLNVLNDYDGIDSMKQHSVEMNVTDAECFFNQDEIALSHGIVKYTENENNTKIIFDMTNLDAKLTNTAMILSVLKKRNGTDFVRQCSVGMNVEHVKCKFVTTKCVNLIYCCSNLHMLVSNKSVSVQSLDNKVFLDSYSRPFQEEDYIVMSAVLKISIRSYLQCNIKIDFFKDTKLRWFAGLNSIISQLLDHQFSHNDKACNIYNVNITGTLKMVAKLEYLRFQHSFHLSFDNASKDYICNMLTLHLNAKSMSNLDDIIKNGGVILRLDEIDWNQMEIYVFFSKSIKLAPKAGEWSLKVPFEELLKHNSNIVKAFNFCSSLFPKEVVSSLHDALGYIFLFVTAKYLR